MTGPAWILIIGCGVCLLLTLAMAVCVVPLARRDRTRKDELSHLRCRLVELQDDIVTIRAEVEARASRKHYTIHEEEYV